MPRETFGYDCAEFLGRARGMSDLSRNTGLTRPALYRALSGAGNPEFSTIAKVADALGYRLNLVLKSDKGSTAAVK